MLKIWMARSGDGKTEAVLRAVAKSGGKRPQLLLVPEQASHEMERRLCAIGGNQVSLFAEVLSFTRLSNRVFAQAGGLAAATLDAGGRLLLMCSALKAVSAQLSVYARPSKKPAFLTSLLATVDECKQYCVTPDALAEAGEETDGQEGEKLRDLALIFGAYDALTARAAADPRDRLTRLAEGLRTCGYAQNTDIYVDGFTDFTPQEGLVLRTLMEQAASVTVAITCSTGGEDDESGIFNPARRTAARLSRLAGEAGVRCETVQLAHGQNSRAPELNFLEENLFAAAPKQWEGERPAVTLFRADSPRSEAEWTASELLRLVREEGCRFREIAVAARGFDRYAPILEEVFSRYGVPVFLDTMTDVLQKPVFGVVTGALDTVAGDYSYDDIFRYLKTGLAGLSREECDLLENYVLKWDIRGNRWTGKAEWSMHPRGYGFPLTKTDETVLSLVNSARRKVTEPLELLRINHEKTGKGQAMALYRFLEAIGLTSRLIERAGELRAGGELKRAEEYRQLWDILCAGLEQCALLLGETPMDLDEFAALFKLVLSQYDVGTIPVSLDRVSAGEAGRGGDAGIKALFLLGADDGAIPQTAPAPGLFTDDDRSLLASFGLELSPSLTEKLDREMTILYETCTRPSSRLIVSWAAMGATGEEKRPSFLQGRLKLLFPGLTVLGEGALGGAFRLSAPRPALELAGSRPKAREALRALPEYAPLIDRMERASALTRGRLSREISRRLHGSKVPMSASRMDKFKSCHFSYFMQYGLKARPRQAAGFQAPEYGTFVHYVLEHVVKGAVSEGGLTLNPGMEEDRKKLRALIRRIMDCYIRDELGGLDNKTPRFIYLFNRLIRPVTQVAENVLEELTHSRFRPISFELGFGSKGDLPPLEFSADGVTVSISGFVDRVDGWVHNGRLYLRVVDYKTGRKSFDLTEIWNGIGLQMLLYLFTLETEGKTLYQSEIAPAGVLYLPAREAVVQGSREMTEEERRRKADAELRRHGLLLDDPAVLEAMERPGEEGIRFLPLKVSAKTGAVSGDSLVTAERLGRLKLHTQRILRDIGEELAAGNIAADPYWRSPEKNACVYCDYAPACHFEDGRGGDCRRFLPGLDGEEFWRAVEGSQTAERSEQPFEEPL